VDGGWSIEIAIEIAQSASRSLARDGQKVLHNQPHTPDRSRRFYLAVRWSGSWPLPPMPTMARQPAIRADPVHGCRIIMNRPCDCGLSAVQSCAPLPVECWPERGLDYAGDLIGLLSADTTNSNAAVHERVAALTTVASSITPLTDHWSKGSKIRR
jgi:hypothetical protein